MRTLTTTLAFALAATLATAATTPARPKHPPGASRNAPVPDAALENRIRQRFSRSKLAQDRFRVTVQNGVATIEGKTDVIQRKGTATRLARLAGARDVVNRVEVSQAARDRATANLAAGRRRAQVKRSETVNRNQR